MGAPGFDVETISRGLAFADAVDDLAAAVRPAGANVVVVAPPGTGKTTVVPAVLADAVRGRVIVTQPRRIAVRAAARRLAQLDRTQLGTRVGFSVRGERVLGPAARVEFVTPGLLLRRLLADPELDGVSAVVLDEVHERQLDTDLLLALLADLRALREDLTAVVMSATLDAERYADLLETTGRPARVVRVEAPAHPLTVRWEPCPTPRLDARGVSRAFLDHVAGSAARAHSQELAADATTDALVFLPGAAEVDHVVAALSRLAPKTEVLALHGRVDAAAQDRAISGRRHDQPPRIVVSTALAESSLTVPGVRLVVDAGLAREPRVDRARAMAGLITLACSKATAVQRAGRATRQAPGVVVRCYEERTHAGAADHLTPEIVSSELSAAMLLLAAWGTPGGNGLRWLDPPPAAAVADATAVLRSLGAVDAEGRITQVGRRLVAMPLDPRWGARCWKRHGRTAPPVPPRSSLLHPETSALVEVTSVGCCVRCERDGIRRRLPGVARRRGWATSRRVRRRQPALPERVQMPWRWPWPPRGRSGSHAASRARPTSWPTARGLPFRRTARCWGGVAGGGSSGSGRGADRGRHGCRDPRRCVPA
ncbi:DEAD/DEAH box helicase [Nocardioides alcanivorans]|uniref:DEAD/DEAH box helicase n=1 Tax=Nocardioides alcanivorans TaxID=2897352 RepID=UPI001F1FC8E1|nr:DEAD/DEAH box helicase [Nocardioides alcanivorans]